MHECRLKEYRKKGVYDEQSKSGHFRLGKYRNRFNVEIEQVHSFELTTVIGIDPESDGLKRAKDWAMKRLKLGLKDF